MQEEYRRARALVVEAYRENAAFTTNSRQHQYITTTTGIMIRRRGGMCSQIRLGFLEELIHLQQIAMRQRVLTLAVVLRRHLGLKPQWALDWSRRAANNSKNFAPAGASSGTSPISKGLGKALPKKLPMTVPAPTTAKPLAKSKVFGRILGHWAPFVAWGLLANDVSQYATCIKECIKNGNCPTK
jgi:hypothetical protein